MFGLTKKEKISALIDTVSKDLINVYKSEMAKTSGITDNAQLEKILMSAQKIYQDAVANECALRLGNQNGYAGGVMMAVLDNPTIIGFDAHDFDYGKNPGLIYCAAYYALSNEQNKDMAYCITLNHKQRDLMFKAVKEVHYLQQAKDGDPYNRFKKDRGDDVQSLFDGVRLVCDMFFSHEILYPSGRNFEDESRIVGLCAYLISGWFTFANPDAARKVCELYGNNFQLYNKPVEYANQMLTIVNNTYREIRAITDLTIKNTTDVSKIVNAQALKFATLSSIPVTIENTASIEETIFYFINQYLTPDDDAITDTVKEEQPDNNDTNENTVEVIIEEKEEPDAKTILIKCPNCNTVIPDGGLFCPKCGTNIAEKTSEINNKQAPEPESNSDIESQKDLVSDIKVDSKLDSEIDSDFTITDKSMDQLRKLKQLYDEGILTEDEFQSKKNQLLHL